jgi:hypothetical protein
MRKHRPVKQSGGFLRLPDRSSLRRPAEQVDQFTGADRCDQRVDLDTRHVCFEVSLAHSVTRLRRLADGNSGHPRQLRTASK